MKRHAILAGVFLIAGCTQSLSAPKPDAVKITLAPDVVSSQDGTVRVTATVLESGTSLENWDVRLSVDYTDRNGVPRMVAGTAGKTGRTGNLLATFAGLTWEGAGTITAAVLDRQGQPALDRNLVPITATASFSVLDLSPPKLTIEPPTSDLRVGPGLPFEVRIHATDEIGLSQIFVQVAGEAVGQSSHLVASGTTNGTVTFDFDVPGGALPGPTITVYAMAADLSGNLAAADAVVLTVDPTVLIAVLPGFTVGTVSTGTGSFLNPAAAIALSPKDSMLYVADNSGGAPCNSHCIRQVNPATMTPAAGVVATGVGSMTGLSFDATGDHLYYTDTGNGGNQSVIVQLTYAGAAYGTPTTCNVPANQNPPGPVHSVFDATLGLLVADQANQRLMRQAACNITSIPSNFSSQFNQSAWGVAQAPGGTDFYVSDDQDNRIYHVTNTGATSLYESAGLNTPEGLEWVAGGPSIFADSLLVASRGSQRVVSTRGNFTPRSAAFFRNEPVDLAISSSSGTLYILTQAGGGPSNGHIFSVSGF